MFVEVGFWIEIESFGVIRVDIDEDLEDYECMVVVEVVSSMCVFCI